MRNISKEKKAYDNYWGTLGKVGNWEYAKSYCNNLSLAGYNNWYLPSKTQLENLYKNIGKIYYTYPDYYWSSSNGVIKEHYAWVVYSNYGGSNEHPKTNLYYIRCVRGR